MDNANTIVFGRKGSGMSFVSKCLQVHSIPKHKYRITSVKFNTGKDKGCDFNNSGIINKTVLMNVAELRCGNPADLEYTEDFWTDGHLTKLSCPVIKSIEIIPNTFGLPPKTADVDFDGLIYRFELCE